MLWVSMLRIGCFQGGCLSMTTLILPKKKLETFEFERTFIIQGSQFFTDGQPERLQCDALYLHLVHWWPANKRRMFTSSVFFSV